MLKQYNEEYFTNVYHTAQRRLSPSGISGFFLATLVFSTIMLVVSMNAVFSTSLFDTNWFLLLFVSAIFWFVHLLTFLIFLKEKVAYKLQKFQVLMLCLISFKTSIEGYVIYFLLCADRNVPPYMYTLGLVILTGGILFMISSFYRAIQSVKKGRLKEDGNGLLSNSKIVPVVVGLIAFIFLSTYALRFIQTPDFVIPIEVILSIIIVTIVQYSIAFGMSEFFLLAYCKFKFPSFIMELPNRQKKGGIPK